MASGVGADVEKGRVDLDCASVVEGELCDFLAADDAAGRQGGICSGDDEFWVNRQKGSANVILGVFVFLHFLTVRFDCQSPEFGFNPDVVVPIDIPIDSFFDLGYWLSFEGVKWFVYEDLMKGFDYDHEYVMKSARFCETRWGRVERDTLLEDARFSHDILPRERGRGGVSGVS